jgi:hypothetical protein
MMNQKFNVTLDFIQPVSGTEADALSVMFGTGQYTDLIELTQYTGSINDLYRDGVIIDMADYLQYMPNLKALMDSDPNYRKQFFNDDGKMLTLTVLNEVPEMAWGGLVYRHDILDTMTGGNVAFPSGNSIPTTIDDWDYMLPLFKMYFEAAGFVDYAPLIIPSWGFFPIGELSTGFGMPIGYYFNTDTNIVGHGALTDGYYEYIKKMNEWFEAGYIYRDFATRVGEPFFLPNTSLTYGGAAGIWYGLQSQLGDLMSMPEFGLFFDVRAIPTPLNTALGITGESVMDFIAPYYENWATFVVTSACEDVPKLLSVLDYMYSHEGGMLWRYGMTADQIPANDTIYTSNGLHEGAYWIDANGNLVVSPLLDLGGGELDLSDFNLIRLPGLSANTDEKSLAAPSVREADAQWARYNDVSKLLRLPNKISYPEADEGLLTSRNVQINDYFESMSQQFIMGTLPFDRQAFNDFKAQLISFGLEDNIRIQQEALDRYLAR